MTNDFRDLFKDRILYHPYADDPEIVDTIKLLDAAQVSEAIKERILSNIYALFYLSFDNYIHYAELVSVIESFEYAPLADDIFNRADRIHEEWRSESDPKFLQRLDENTRFYDEWHRTKRLINKIFSDEKDHEQTD